MILHTLRSPAGEPIAYVCASTYEERELPKRAGFKWDVGRREWFTRDPEVACKLVDYADPPTKALLGATAAAREAALAGSRATTAAVEIPAPEGLEYLPFQKAGIAYAMSRPACLIADEMGLGKTIQALGVINADPTIRRVLVLCPATLKLNWAREASRWLTRPFDIAIATARAWPLAGGRFDIIPCPFVIANYDILAKHQNRIAGPWDLLVVDEAHYLKNPKACRTVYVHGGEIKGSDRSRVPGITARRRLYLTGTPIVNRPIELHALLSALDPDRWGNFWAYVRRYCGAYRGRYGWDFSGAENLDELQDRLRASIMVRRLKRDVLTELPPKRRQIIEIDTNGAAPAVAWEHAAWARHEEGLITLRAAAELAKADEDPETYERAVDALREGTRLAFTEISAARHETALAKVPHVIAHLKDAVEASGKVVCFAHHKDVIKAIAEAFEGAAVTLTGETSMGDRQAAVDRFQSDPACTVFVGSITAAGVGITLTAAAHVVFSELDWVPGNISQAEDRCHRIGQTESVLIQHLVLDGSLDAKLAKTLVAKQEVIDKALDEQTSMVLPGEAPELSASRKAIADLAETLTAADAERALAMVRYLAGRCDFAEQKDGAGFNKLDARIGHQLADRPALSLKQAALALRMMQKYRKQLERGGYTA